MCLCKLETFYGDPIIIHHVLVYQNCLLHMQASVILSLKLSSFLFSSSSVFLCIAVSSLHKIATYLIVLLVLVEHFKKNLFWPYVTCDNPCKCSHLKSKHSMCLYFRRDMCCISKNLYNIAHIIFWRYLNCNDVLKAV